MIIRQFVRRFFHRDLNAGLHPIKESGSYVRFLESRFFEQGNPFRRLLLNTEADMKAPVFSNPDPAR